MNKVTVRAPVRADLAGGTLDLWPLYLFHPGARTVNVAISYYAESEVAETGDSGIEIHLTDQQYEQRYESLHEIAADPKAALIHRVLEHFRMNGIRITTRTDAPRGSGLGGSSALTVTLVRALSELAGNPIEGEELIALVRDLETRLIGVPAGIQDYYPAVYGGLAALHLNPGAVIRHEIPLPIERLAEHMLLHYSGVAHFSGTNNWEMYKRQIDGKRKVHKGFEKIAQSATEMERALVNGDFRTAGAALAHEWTHRKALINGISTPEIDAAIEAATTAGAWGGKVCGAGGGGCIVFLVPPDRRFDVRRALSEVPGRILEATPVAHGLTIDRSQAAQVTTGFPARGRHVPARSESIEQLYVYGGRGPHKPFVLAEAIITLTEPRSGAHQSVGHAYAAPIDVSEATVAWNEARSISSDALDLHAEPDPNRRISSKISIEAIVQAAAQSEEGFRQFVSENERMQIFHNPSFGIFSEPHESRAAFAQRCLEEATRRLEDEAERLESTFRRRIDQVKERSERELREEEAKEERTAETPVENVMSWGQTLYNITSGKPAAVIDAPQSAREGDYMEKIAQIQRAWDKELHAKRDELNAQAREIEELIATPSPKNIEITKYLIVWAARL
jgi:D-glycero-alpha-D-manno-heptose-7-phosphate kinase